MTDQQKLTVLVVGASGATGRFLADQLLKRGHTVRAVVRTPEKLPEWLQNRDGLNIIKGAILDFTDIELAKLVHGCDAIASCLGHNLSFKGMFCPPRRLVTDATRRLCDAVIAGNPFKPVKFVLMNTSGNRNRDLQEPVSFAQHVVLALLRLLVPPHADNEQAADHLRTKIGKDHQQIEWTAVRPDGLVDEKEVTAYETHPSPIRNAIFDAGKVSRINVADFMAELIHNDVLWQQWKGQMPVIYSKA